jgi:hypothetical protein
VSDYNYIRGSHLRHCSPCRRLCRYAVPRRLQKAANCRYWCISRIRSTCWRICICWAAGAMRGDIGVPTRYRSRRQDRWRGLQPARGVSLSALSWLALYGSYVQSFGAANAGLSRTGEAFDPETATQYEERVKRSLRPSGPPHTAISHGYSLTTTWTRQ